jgi:hypothetical protein
MFSTSLMHRFDGNAQPLTEQTIRRFAPSAFAEQPAADRSERYAFIKTADIITGMQQHGFQVVRAAESRTRVEERRGFTKHMIVFRHADHMGQGALRVHQRLPEIVLINSHDGSSSYQLHAGILECICTNGLIVADQMFATVKVQHTGRILDSVIEGADHVMRSLPDLLGTAEVWSGLRLTQPMRLAFADAAADLRWDEHERPVTPAQLLTPHRRDDDRPDLWKTFNVVQENILRGGLKGQSPTTGRRSRTRAVNSVSENVRTNKALWRLAGEMARLIGVAAPAQPQGDIIDVEAEVIA